MRYTIVKGYNEGCQEWVAHTFHIPIHTYLQCCQSRWALLSKGAIEYHCYRKVHFNSWMQSAVMGFWNNIKDKNDVTHWPKCTYPRNVVYIHQLCTAYAPTSPKLCILHQLLSSTYLHTHHFDSKWTTLASTTRLSNHLFSIETQLSTFQSVYRELQGQTAPNLKSANGVLHIRGHSLNACGLRRQYEALLKIKLNKIKKNCESMQWNANYWHVSIKEHSAPKSAANIWMAVR